MGRLLFALIKKLFATLLEALRKIEPNSTFRDGFCNLSSKVFGRCKVC